MVELLYILLAIFYFTVLCIAAKVTYDMCDFQFARLITAVTMGVLAANQITKLTLSILNWIVK